MYYAFAADRGSTQEQKSRDGLVLYAAGSAWHPLLGAEWSWPPLLFHPHAFFHQARLSSQIQQIEKKKTKKKAQRERDSGWDREPGSPQLSSSSCLYACLIGQKQHACLCSQANGWTLHEMGGPGFKHRLCLNLLLLLLGCLRDVFLPLLCQLSLPVHRRRAGGGRLAGCCRCRLAPSAFVVIVLWHGCRRLSRWQKYICERLAPQWEREQLLECVVNRLHRLRPLALAGLWSNRATESPIVIVSVISSGGQTAIN